MNINCTVRNLLQPGLTSTDTNTVNDTLDAEEAAAIAKLLRINFATSKFNLGQFTQGLNTELKHRRKYQTTKAEFNALITIAKITYAHLNEFPDYYTRLNILEQECKAYWQTQN